MMRRFFPLALALIALLYLAQGLYYARVLVPVHDGVQYLLVGAKVVRGELSPFDDRLPGHRVPLPFYVLGLTQLWGPTLLGARWLNVGFGLLTLLITAGLARRLAGDRAAVLAGLFFATQGVVVAYYSYENYHAFAAFCFTATLFVLLGGDSPRRRLLGTALVGLLFFVRSNLWPAIPFLLGLGLRRARGLVERLLLAVVVVLPPLIFFAWDSRHLKLLAYLPVARTLVAPLGYVSAFVLDARAAPPLAGQLWQIARTARRYEFWILATLVLALLLVWRTVRGRPFPWAAEKPTVVLLGTLLVYMIGAQFLIDPTDRKSIAIYFLDVAPLVPVLLGVGFARFLADASLGPRSRRLLLTVMAGLLLPPLYFVRNPLLPTVELLAKDPFMTAHLAAHQLAEVVPRDARVFFYGRNHAYYLSGLPHTYLQQLFEAEQFAQIEASDRVLRRSGFVPVSDMREWLTRDAMYAVIDTAFLEHQRRVPSLGNPEEEMVTLIGRHFDLIDTVDEAPYRTYAVYRRKAAERS